MRVVITGGTGLIGRALARDLVSAGYEVVVLSRDPARAPAAALPASVRVEGWDARSAEGWGRWADGAEAVVNLAGASISGRWTATRKRLIRESRLEAGRAVVQAVEAAQVRPRVVVQASGVGYYGPRGDEALDETASPGADFLGRLAVAWESSTAPVKGLGVRQVVIRTGLVLSAEGGVLPRLALPFRLFVGGPLGSGRQWMPWIHIADQVRAIRFLIEDEGEDEDEDGDASGPFNLAAPHPLTNAALGRVLGRVLNRPAVLPVPAPALRLLFGEMATLLLDGQRAMPRRLLDLGFTFRFPEAESALRDLLKGGETSF